MDMCCLIWDRGRKLFQKGLSAAGANEKNIPHD